MDKDRMTAVQVKPWQLPAELVSQKDWDVEVYYREALVNPDWVAWAFLRQDEVVGCLLLHDSLLHRSVIVDTLIIDRRDRGVKTVKTLLSAACKLVEGRAQERGLPFVQWSTDHPEAQLRLLGALEVERAGEVLRYRVEEVAR